VIVLILCGTYYTFAFVHSAAPYLTWLAFLLKICLSLALMTIQIACLFKIKSMILEVVDLEYNYNEQNQHLFVFIFFAANAVMEAGATLLFVDFQHDINTSVEKDFWTSAYVLIAVFYFISNMLFMNILQRVWSHKNFDIYLCPILDKEIPMIVYIKNRRLFRVRRENRYSESTEEQEKVIKKDVESMNPVDII